jgi:hypothetical protein
VTPGAGTLTVSAPGLLSSVAHDSTLAGNGSSAAPLGVATQGVGTAQLADNSVTSAKIAPGQVGTTQLANIAVTTAQLADNAVTASKIAPGQVVKTLNGITDNVSLTTDANLTITPGGNMLKIAAPNMLTSIAHDASLAGNGTSASPLSVAAAAAPAQQPVTFTTTFDMPGGSNLCFTGCSDVYTVPQGQRLVIQQLAAGVSAGTFNSLAHAGAFLNIDGQIPFPQVPIILTAQDDGGAYAFAGSQQVTIYVDAGHTVQFGGSQGGSSHITSFTFYFAGYLVPAP